MGLTSGLHMPATKGTSVQVMGEKLTFKVTTADSHGQFFLMELESQPGAGTPVHTHPSDDEFFYVLSGQFKFLIIEDGRPREIIASAGDTVMIPGALPHSYTVIGPEPGKTITCFTPGRDVEAFFTEAGTYFETPQEEFDFGKFLDMARSHNMNFPPEFLPAGKQ